MAVSASSKSDRVLLDHHDDPTRQNNPNCHWLSTSYLQRQHEIPLIASIHESDLHQDLQPQKTDTQTKLSGSVLDTRPDHKDWYRASIQCSLIANERPSRERLK